MRASDAPLPPTRSSAASGLSRGRVNGLADEEVILGFDPFERPQPTHEQPSPTIPPLLRVAQSRRNYNRNPLTECVSANGELRRKSIGSGMATA